MKIALTGATGFIGSHVVKVLVRCGMEVTATSRNKERAVGSSWYQKVKYVPYDMNAGREDVYDFLGRPDVLIHLAWEGLPNYAASFHMERNLPANRLFLERMIKSGLRSLVVTGTCFEYGMQTGCLSEEAAPAPVVLYGQAKDHLRRNIEQWHQEYGLDYKWVRLFYMYGQGQNEKSLLSQLVKALDRKDCSFNMSAGEQERDFLPVEEVAENIVKIALQDKVNGVINCCSGKPVTVRKFVEDYLAGVGKKIDLNLGYYSYPPHEPMSFWGDTKKMHRALSAGKGVL